MLHRLLAMTFGRPFMVYSSYNTPIPSLIDDKYLQIAGEGLQPASVPSHMGLFVYSCKLFEILADTLSTFYTRAPGNDVENGSSVEEMISNILKLVRRLENFDQTLPCYLKPASNANSSVSDQDGYINLQQQVLYCR